MSMEGASIADKIAPEVWAILKTHFCKQCFTEAPTYQELLLAEIVKSARAFRKLIPTLDEYKFNKLPCTLNSTDVILHSCLPCNKSSWRLKLFTIILVRRFANNGAWFLALVQFLSLEPAKRAKCMQSPKHFLEIPLKKDYVDVLQNLMEHFSAVEFNQAQGFAKQLFGCEATFGYQLPPWTLGGDSAPKQKRLETFTAGVQATALFCQNAHSLVEAKGRLHSVVTAGSGFILYQIDMLVDKLSSSANISHMFARERHAGPGMIPFALEFGYGANVLEVDETKVAAARDDGDHSDPDSEPKKKRSKKNVGACTEAERRMAVAACNLFTELIFASSLWGDICRHFGLHGLCPQAANSGSVDSNVSFAEKFRHHQAALLDMYDLVEYAFCEFRRLLHNPKAHSRGACQSQPLRSMWEGVVFNAVSEWRLSMIYGGRVHRRV